MSIRKGTNIVPLSFQRPDQGPYFSHSGETDFELSGAPRVAQQWRAYSRTPGAKLSIHVGCALGQFAGGADPSGGSLRALCRARARGARNPWCIDPAVLGGRNGASQELTNGLHYSDASNLRDNLELWGTVRA